MNADAYEILALFMRYVFVVLGGLILLRAFHWLRKDQRMYRKELRRLPDAGYVGEMVDLDTGQVWPIPREGTLGSSPLSDIWLFNRGIARRHLDFLFVDGKGLCLTPRRRKKVTLDGTRISRHAYALHGSILQAERANLGIRLFEGLNTPDSPPVRDVEEMEEIPADPFGAFSPVEAPEEDDEESGESE